MVHVDRSFETMGDRERIMILPFTSENLRITFAIFRILPAFKRAAIQMRPEVEEFIARLEKVLSHNLLIRTLRLPYRSNAESITICDRDTRVNDVLGRSDPNLAKSSLGSEHVRVGPRF